MLMTFCSIRNATPQINKNVLSLDFSRTDSKTDSGASKNTYLNNFKKKKKILFLLFSLKSWDNLFNSSFTETNKNSFQERFASLAAWAILVSMFLPFLTKKNKYITKWLLPPFVEFKQRRLTVQAVWNTGETGDIFVSRVGCVLSAVGWGDDTC